jgi:hypothetical protein
MLNTIREVQYFAETLLLYTKVSISLNQESGYVGGMATGWASEESQLGSQQAQHIYFFFPECSDRLWTRPSS